MYGVNQREPLVVITVPGGESMQLSPEQARAHAQAVLECAEAAEQDGFIVEFALETFAGRPDPEHAAAVLLDQYRKWREKRGSGKP